MAERHAYQAGGDVIDLPHSNLIAGSETVTMDGEILTRGDNYTIHYSNGTLDMHASEVDEIKCEYKGGR